MLDLDKNRTAVPPREAATLLLVRDRDERLEVFCVVRHVKSGFLGGAVVFPGGKVDDSDRDADWAKQAHGAARFELEEDEAISRAYAVAACREALEEAAILPAASRPLTHEEAIALRAELANAGRADLAKEGTGFLAALAKRSLTLELATLHPFARWVTPIAEGRRFDTRFFLAAAPLGQEGAHDAHETTASFWGTPREVLERFDRAEIQLAPPTHRCLELLTTVSSTHDAFALSARLTVDPICPRLVEVPKGEETEASLALVLPGDPDHEIAVPRVPGRSRFVLRGERWVPEDAAQGPTSLP